MQQESTPKQAKRKLKETSPEENMAKKPVGNMDVDDLMNLMKTTMNSLLEEKLQNLPTKTDFDEIKSEITLAATEIGALRTENVKLKAEIEKLKDMREEDANNIRWLEHQIKSTKLIFKGISSATSASESVLKVCTDNLKTKPKIISAHKVFEQNGKQTAIVEFENESSVLEILKATNHLAGTSISIDRDLNPRRQKNKKAMLIIRKQILAENKVHKIIVRDDKMKIKDKWFVWNAKNELISGNNKGEQVLKSIYGDSLKTTNFNNVFEEINSKN